MGFGVDFVGQANEVVSSPREFARFGVGIAAARVFYAERFGAGFDAVTFGAAVKDDCYAAVVEGRRRSYDASFGFGLGWWRFVGRSCATAGGWCGWNQRQ